MRIWVHSAAGQRFCPQVIKDAAMAHAVCEVAAAAPAQDKFLVVCGAGHSGSAQRPWILTGKWAGRGQF